MTNPDLSASLYGLADELGIEVFTDLDDPRGASSQVQARTIHVGKRLTPLSYFISLHEMGHVVHQDRDMWFSDHPLHNEVSASYWAFQHMTIPWSSCIEQATFDALKSYTSEFSFEEMDRSMLEEMLTPEHTHVIEDS